MRIYYKSRSTGLDTIIICDDITESGEHYKVTSKDGTIKVLTDEFILDTHQKVYYIFKCTIDGALDINREFNND